MGHEDGPCAQPPLASQPVCMCGRCLGVGAPVTGTWPSDMPTSSRVNMCGVSLVVNAPMTGGWELPVCWCVCQKQCTGYPDERDRTGKRRTRPRYSPSSAVSLECHGLLPQTHGRGTSEDPCRAHARSKGENKAGHVDAWACPMACPLVLLSKRKKQQAHAHLQMRSACLQTMAGHSNAKEWAVQLQHCASARHWSSGPACCPAHPTRSKAQAQKKHPNNPRGWCQVRLHF